jgi:AcrR family transcriptional regulator
VPYHHGNLREALVEAGVDLAAKDGPESVTLRAVSRQVGVSHNAAYRHFADHDALMEAISARPLARWGELMAARIGAVRGRSQAAAWKRLEAAGRAYVEFAVTSPGLFGIACSVRLGTVQPDSGVRHCYAQNAEIACWSAVHGFATLVSDGPLRDAPAAVREAGLDEVLRVVREGV